MMSPSVQVFARRHDEPHHLAGTQSAAIAEAQENASLEAARHRQQPLGLVRANDERQLLRLRGDRFLGNKVESPERDTEQELHPGHDAVAIADAHAALDEVQLEAAYVIRVAVSGDRFRNAANRLQLWMWLLCECAPSLRAVMSSIIR